MTARMDALIHQAYRVPELREGNNLILQEDSNANNSQALFKIKLNIKNIQACTVYKFDQAATIDRFVCRQYAPFLQPGGACAMCDFIIFFRSKAEPAKLAAWVVNLKSSKDNNNTTQMRAGYRLCEFLLGKLDDVLKNQDKPEDLQRGDIDFILFSSPQTKAIRGKTTTNALNKKPGRNSQAGRRPDDALRVTAGAYELHALRRDEV